LPTNLIGAHANRQQPANVRSRPPLHHQTADHTDRTKRVKDARSEAQKEIEEYRGQKEVEFKNFEQEVRVPWTAARSERSRGKHSSGNKKMEEEANKDTERKLQEIKQIGKSKGEKVVKDLLGALVNVKPEPPKK
jgi:V-type H+-transporting ATPase subunit G